MISYSEFIMGRDKEFPLTVDLAINAAKTLAAVNYIRGRYGLPLKNSSGYRPGYYNVKAGGAENSSHLTCEAEDLEDLIKVMVLYEGKEIKIGEFAAWCLDNLDELKKAGLYMEHPAYTNGWVHLTTRKPPSGKRVFIPGKRAK